METQSTDTNPIKPTVKNTILNNIRPLRERVPTLSRTGTATAITGAMFNAASIVSRHDPTIEQTSTSMLMNHIGDVNYLINNAKRHTKAIFHNEKRRIQESRRAQKQRTVRVDKATLTEPVRTQMKHDIVAMANDERTAYDVKRPLPASQIRANFDQMYNMPGDTMHLDLGAVGLRPTPNMKKALAAYSENGRATLVSSGLIPDQTGPKQTQTRPRGKTPSGGMEI